MTPLNVHDSCSHKSENFFQGPAIAGNAATYVNLTKSKKKFKKCYIRKKKWEITFLTTSTNEEIQSIFFKCVRLALDRRIFYFSYRQNLTTLVTTFSLFYEHFEAFFKKNFFERTDELTCSKFLIFTEKYQFLVISFIYTSRLKLFILKQLCYFYLDGQTF